jgi:hypothetical protein
MLITQLTDNRSRNMAWQSQDTYRWHLIHTDKDIDMMPKKRKETIRLRMFRALETPFGKGFDNLSSAGPP